MQPSQIYHHLHLNHIIWPLFIFSRLTIHTIYYKQYALLKSSIPCLDMYRHRSHRFIFQTDCQQRRNHNDVRNIDSTNQKHEGLQAAPSAADIHRVIRYEYSDETIPFWPLTAYLKHRIAFSSSSSEELWTLSMCTLGYLQRAAVEHCGSCPALPCQKNGMPLPHS